MSKKENKNSPIVIILLAIIIILLSVVCVFGYKIYKSANTPSNNQNQNNNNNQNNNDNQNNNNDNQNNNGNQNNNDKEDPDDRFTIAKNSSMSQLYSKDYDIFDNEKNKSLHELLGLENKQIVGFEKLDGKYYAFVTNSFTTSIYEASTLKHVRTVDGGYSEVTGDGLVHFTTGFASVSEMPQVVWSPKLEKTTAYKEANSKYIAENNGKVTVCNDEYFCTILDANGKIVKDKARYEGILNVGFGTIVTYSNKKIIVYTDEGKVLYLKEENKNVDNAFYQQDHSNKQNYFIRLSSQGTELSYELVYDTKNKTIEQK